MVDKGVLQTIEVVSFDYGQKHRKELTCAKSLAQVLDLRWELIDLTSFGPQLRSSLTTPHVPIPEGHYAAENMKQTVVPNRNAIFLSVAAGIAISRDLNTVAAAYHTGDHAIYPDCRPAFIDSFNRMLALATEWTPVRVQAPYIKTSKAGILKAGLKLGVPYEKTWTCYVGLDAACGRCGTCVERLEAFEENGADDPLVYSDRRYWKTVVDV
jgi:7-cyano-7-deazaguanine synthase